MNSGPVWVRLSHTTCVDRMRRLHMKFVCTSLMLLFAVHAAYAETIVITPKSAGDLPARIEQAKPVDVILVRSGSYVFPEAVSIKGKKDLMISGEGNARIICTNIDAHVISIEGSMNIRLTGLKLRHEAGKERSCTGDVISISKSSQVWIEACELNGSGAVGVRAYDSRTILIKDSCVRNNSVAAMAFNKTKHIAVTGNRIEDNAMTMIGADASGELMMQGNTIKNNTSPSSKTDWEFWFGITVQAN
jgi:hypothetical protein